MSLKMKNRELDTLDFVALEGFEPSQAEPESEVLPLHHKAMRLSLRRCKDTTFF